MAVPVAVWADKAPQFRQDLGVNRSFFVNIRGFAVVSRNLLINIVKFQNKSVNFYVFRDLAIKISR